jgi:hypothetical protein
MDSQIAANAVPRLELSARRAARYCGGLMSRQQPTNGLRSSRVLRGSVSVPGSPVAAPGATSSVTRHPPPDWPLQQFRDRFPEAVPCRYAILDHDSTFDGIIGFLEATGESGTFKSHGKTERRKMDWKLPPRDPRPYHPAKRRRPRRVIGEYDATGRISGKSNRYSWSSFPACFGVSAPKRPSLSSFGPAVKNRVLVGPAAPPLPNRSPHKPSISTG